MVDVGFEAGLRYWLVFLVVFYFLGYPVPLSIFLGGLAGLAGGFLASYWKNKAVSKPPEPKDEGQDRPFRGISRRLEQWRKDQQERTGRSLSIVNWFGRRSRRTLKDRRK